MARMIPSQMDSQTPSEAERRVFDLLKTDSATKDWTVLHSLGLARRASGPYGEIDFVVIIPTEGIVCLEVKGGRVSCQSGNWQTGNHILKKSPFLQAREGMFALRKALIQHFGEGTPESRCPIGCAVVFPDVLCPPLTPEFERADAIDLDDLKNPISRSIMRVVRQRLRQFQPREGSQYPTLSEVKAIRLFLRPDFDMVVTRSVSIGRTEAKLLSLTEEQYDRLDELEANPRCLFDGAAGTGKTLLALEYVRRADRSGSKVLFVCFNRLLGEWLCQQVEGMDVVVGTWHTIVRRLILASSLADEFEKQEREALQAGNTSLLFRELYPLYGQAAMEENPSQFDILVMDEAQDFGNQHSFELLNMAICDGISGGRWAIFGDFTRQALYGNTVNPIEVLSGYTNNFVRARLTLNCRNTRNIATETAILTGFTNMPFRLGTEAGLPVEHKYWATSSGLMKSLSGILEALISENISIDSVIILSPRRLKSSSLAEVKKISRFRLIDISQDRANTHSDIIKFSTIHSFKGLESQVVIIVDIDTVDDDQAKSLLYVAMSRARSLLILMAHKRVRKDIESLIKKNIQERFLYE